MNDQRQTKPSTEPGIEMRPDAWERFEQAVDAAVKAGPKHRKATEKQQAAKKK